MINTSPKVIYPKHEYKLDEKTGTVVYDNGTTPVNGVNTACTINQDGYRGKAYTFNGSSSEIIMSGFSEIAQGSMIVWFKCTGSAGTNNSIFTWGDADWSHYGSLFIGANTSTWPNESFTYTNFSPAWAGSNAMHTAVTKGHDFYLDGKWHCAIIVMDGIDNRIYIDGIKQTLSFGAAGSLTTPNAFIKPDSGTLTYFRIGNYYSSKLSPYKGDMQRMEILDGHYITDEEAKYLYNYGFNQNIMDLSSEKMVLWNKLGSTAQTTKSEIGQHGVELGNTYATGKFNDGFRVDANGEYVTFSNVLDNLTVKGSLNLWINPYDNFDDGSTDRYIWTSVGSDMFLFYDASENLWTFTIGGQSATFSDTSVPDDVPIHLACIWDNGVTNKVQIKVDNVEGSPSTTTFTTPNDTDLRIGNNNSNNADAQSVLDNIKIHNYAKSDFSDKDVEYPIKINGTNIATTPLEQIVLWNTFHNAEELADSRIGNNFTTPSTPAYADCKFDQGLNITSVNNSSSVANPLSTMQRGFISAQLKPNWASGSITAVYVTDADAAYRCAILWQDNGTAVGFHFYLNGTYLIEPQDSEFTWSHSASEVFHIAVTWDLSGIDGGSDTARMYLNGQLFKTSALTPASTTPATTIYIGKRYNNVSAFNGVMENFKMGNYAKTDFSDKDVKEPIDMQKVITI